MEEPKTVVASMQSRLIWPLAAVMLVIGVLLLLNADSIGRMAIGAYEASRSRAGGYSQPTAPASARALPQVEPVGSARPMPPVAADEAIPAPPSDTAGTSTLPEAATTAAPAQSLERLYAPPPAATTVARAATPAGRVGLVMLVRSGVLRPASGNAVARWKARYASSNPRPAGPRFDEWTRHMPVYEIVGDMTFPDGLGGANAAVFLIGDRAPYPSGDPGHSVILDPVSGTCIGVTCSMLLGE